MLKIGQKIRQSIQAEKNRRIIARKRKELKVKEFTIISQNCIGGVFYHDMGLRFMSPTVNLYIPEPGFIKMVKNLEKYMAADPVVRWNGLYPVGLLCEDVTIHFLHYSSCEEAFQCWQERKSRILWDRIVVVATDRDGFSKQLFEEWKQIPYPKILLTVHEEYAGDSGTVLYREYLKDGEVPDLIPRREFYRDNLLIKVINYYQ